jgi:hypothetical protein
MIKKVGLDQRLRILFERLNDGGAARSLPERESLSEHLGPVVDRAIKSNNDLVRVKPELTSRFATAAVEMWQRGVHSLLISAALTETSPVWSSVSGYYASHYCVRGIGHLIGAFQLHKKKRIVQIDIEGGQHLCHIIKKNGGDREHRFYWKVVKEHATFSDDPLFTANLEDTNESDIAHRSVANYSDHVDHFPFFTPLNKDQLKLRIDKISTMDLSSIPIPNRNKFPDLSAVQIVAYYRLVRFRNFLDQHLDDTSRFWQIHRTPSWCSEYLDFQSVSPRFLQVFSDRPTQ